MGILMNRLRFKKMCATMGILMKLCAPMGIRMKNVHHNGDQKKKRHNRDPTNERKKCAPQRETTIQIRPPHLRRPGKNHNPNPDLLTDGWLLSSPHGKAGSAGNEKCAPQRRS